MRHRKFVFSHGDDDSNRDIGTHHHISTMIGQYRSSLVCHADGIYDATMNRFRPYSCGVTTLDPDQAFALSSILCEGRSVFLTGIAGSGKSLVCRELIDVARDYVLPPVVTEVAAPTGIVACALGGRTLHSLLRIGKEAPFTCERAFQTVNRYCIGEWAQIQILVIDEISMVQRSLFETAHVCLCYAKYPEMRSCATWKEAEIYRKKHGLRPFGGVQMVFSGHFFQLPPITDHRSRNQPEVHLFLTDLWKETVQDELVLTRNHRQKSDDGLCELMERISRGIVTKEDDDELRKLVRPTITPEVDNITPFIFTHRIDAESRNTLKLQSLPAETEHRYEHSSKVVEPDAENSDHLRIAAKLKQMANSWEEPLVLRLGARVMLRVNVDQKGKLINGTCGDVTGFDPETGWPIVRFHTQPDNTYVIGPTRWILQRNPMNRNKFVSIVRHHVVLSTSSFPTKLAPLPGQCVGILSATPLWLAYALTVHKAQGSTLQAVALRLNKAFACGQGFVALSRVTTKAGLCLLAYDRAAIYADPVVVQYYNTMLQNKQDHAHDVGPWTQRFGPQYGLQRHLQLARIAATCN